MRVKNQKYVITVDGGGEKRGTFNSKIILGIAKKEIKKFVPKVYLVRPKKEPVAGAVKLALEQIK